MIILGIETSCDETGVAVVKDGTQVLSNVVASSEELHQKTGGIVPEVAAREQVRCLLPVLQEALDAALGKGDLKEQMAELSSVAVTVGPGLIGSLVVGVQAARTLAWYWQKPLVPVNHLVAHLYGNWLTEAGSQTSFPAVALVVSGGHTELVLMKGHGQLTWLGGTLDDAAGEAFDKVARLLGFGYPGGPAISREAEKYEGQEKDFLPRPLLHSGDFNFSFSGLKTAVMREVGRRSVEGLAWEFQEAVTEILVGKALRAAAQVGAKSVLLAGGVAANQRLRDKLGESAGKVRVYVPPISFCTDNAAMVASAAHFNYSPCPWEQVSADPSLEIV